MEHINASTRLTDSLERELMARAIEEQMRFKPGKALKAFFVELASKLSHKEQHVSAESAQTAS